MTEQPTGVRFQEATPILRVADFAASLAYYTDILGFRVAWTAGTFGCVQRGGASLFLCQGEQGHAGTWVFLAVSDSDAYHEEILARGAKIRHAPTNFPWGSRELHVFDPDGHVLRCASDVSEGEPLGPWLAEDGTRWLPKPDGSWEKMP